MASKFADVKPWPVAVPAVAAPGHNKPPLEESILIDFREGLAARDGLLERINQLAAKGDEAKPCTDADTAGRYGDFIKLCAASAKAVEDEREKHNRPLILANKSLKAEADRTADKARDAGAKVRAHLDKYLAEEEAKRIAEERRLAAVAREEQAARQRIADAAAKKARDEAAAEQARLQAIEDAKAAAEKREAAAIVVEPEPVFVPEPEPVFVAAPTRAAPIRGDLGGSVSVTTTWHCAIENMRQLPNLILNDPAVVEAARKVVHAMVRRANGTREMKGVKIWSTTGSSVR